MDMEKDIYSYSIIYTIHSKRGTIKESTPVQYVYTNEEILSKEGSITNRTIATFKSCYEDIYLNAWPRFTSQESIFGKPVIVHYDIFKQPFKIKEKDFIDAKVRLLYHKHNSTIKDYAEKLPADDFIAYCLDKGIGERYLNVL